MNDDCEVVFYLDLQAALRMGLPCFKSASLVILTPGIGRGVVPKEFTQKVKGLHTGQWI